MTTDTVIELQFEVSHGCVVFFDWFGCPLFGRSFESCNQFLGAVITQGSVGFKCDRVKHLVGSGDVGELGVIDEVELYPFWFVSYRVAFTNHITPVCWFSPISSSSSSGAKLKRIRKRCHCLQKESISGMQFSVCVGWSS